MELTVLLRWNSNDIFMDSEDSQDNAWTHKQFLEPKGTQWTQKKNWKILMLFHWAHLEELFKSFKVFSVSMSLTGRTGLTLANWEFFSYNWAYYRNRKKHISNVITKNFLGTYN